MDLLTANLCNTEGFEEFLTQFKCSPEQAITDGLGKINIDEDDLSDNDDLMNEDDGARARRRRERSVPQHKYKKLLQKLANREITDLVIDLDDLESVGLHLAHSSTIAILKLV